MEETEKVTDKDFEKKVLNSKMPVLVDFMAPWCASCKALSPIINGVAQKFKDKIKVVKLDVGENPDSATKFAVMSLPTLLIFRDGKAVNQITGATTEKAISKELENVI